MKLDTKRIMAEIRENRARLDGCPAHRFGPEYPGPGRPYTCLRCGGQMPGGDLLAYCAGFAAAGGDPGGVWPLYEDLQTRVTRATEQL